MHRTPRPAHDAPGDGPEPAALTVAEMREADRRAIEEFGIPGVVLMENAGRGATAVALEMLRDESRPRVVVLAGRGNNGGDGYVIARHLVNAGVDVRVRVLAEFNEITGDARTNLDIIRNMKLDVTPMRLPEEAAALRRELTRSHLVVDAMLGTGTHGEVRNPFRTAIRCVNEAGRPVLAVDIPSGMNGDTGEVLGACVVATATATFGAPKVGMLSDAARKLLGRLTVVDIGMPRELLKSPLPPGEG